MSVTTIEDLQAKLPTVFLDRVRLQFRLLHSEVTPDHSSKGFYNECQAALTEEFVFHDISGNRGQKRTTEVVDGDSNAYGI